MKRLQDVLAVMSDKEAEAVWHALAAHVENEECNDLGEGDPTTLQGLVERLDAVVAGLAE